jgi:hypothetical protein
MSMTLPLVRPLVLGLLVIANLAGSTLAQEAPIPARTAMRQALQKPSGPLTEQDLFSLTNLNACCRNISNVEGLEAARNLVSLNLQINDLTNIFLPSQFTNLVILNLKSNLLTNLASPGNLTRLNSLDLRECPLPNRCNSAPRRNERQSSGGRM